MIDGDVYKIWISHTAIFCAVKMIIQNVGNWCKLGAWPGHGSRTGRICNRGLQSCNVLWIDRWLPFSSPFCSLLGFTGSQSSVISMLNRARSLRRPRAEALSKGNGSFSAWHSSLWGQSLQKLLCFSVFHFVAFFKFDSETAVRNRNFLLGIWKQSVSELPPRVRTLCVEAVLGRQKGIQMQSVESRRVMQHIQSDWLYCCVSPVKYELQVWFGGHLGCTCKKKIVHSSSKPVVPMYFYTDLQWLTYASLFLSIRVTPVESKTRREEAMQL